MWHGCIDLSAVLGLMAASDGKIYSWGGRLMCDCVVNGILIRKMISTFI